MAAVSKTRGGNKKNTSSRERNGLFPCPLKSVARLVGGTVVGNPAVRVTGICGIREAGPGQLTFMADARYAHLLKSTRASAVITSRDVRSAPIPMIQTKNPSLAFAKLASYVYPERERHFEGVHPKAWIAKTARLGKGVSVHAFAVVDEAARIGDRTVICPGCYVGRTARIGNDCVIYPNVSIRERVEIGHRVIIHSGTVVGSDGFGFATVKGIHHKIPQIGTVVIEDDVELGANVTIDRARFGKTVIGRGTKLDNLVQVAHNVEIGPNCIMVAQSGISGSTRLGSHVVLAGQVGVVGHITLGDNVMVGAQSGVTKSIPGNTQVWGYPAKPLARAKRINAAVQRLPELHQRVDALRKQLASLEKRIEGRND